jgi:hypothetical protein
MAVSHFEHSTYREKLLEHLFVGELLRHLWQKGIFNAEFLRPEVDNGGYDLSVGYGSSVRHIQLKTSHLKGKASYQKVRTRLAEKPSGCVVWIMFDENTLTLGPFLWFGGEPGKPLPDISTFPIAKHTKGNAMGKKAERSNVRVVKRRFFERLSSIEELAPKLFGVFK